MTGSEETTGGLTLQEARNIHLGKQRRGGLFYLSTLTLFPSFFFSTSIHSLLARTSLPCRGCPVLPVDFRARGAKSESDIVRSRNLAVARQ